jgi:long-chain acyl-CoA synthetase
MRILDGGLNGGNRAIPHNIEGITLRIEELLLNHQYAQPGFNIHDDQGVWSYPEICARVLALAAKLKEGGVQAQERVALVSENSSSFLVGFLGILTVGAVAVPLDPQLPAAVIEERVSQCAIAWICTSGVRPEKTFGNQTKLSSGGAILSEVRGDWGPVNPEHPVLQSVSGHSIGWPTGSEEDPAVILFSSGTTGTPKGVVLTHRAIITNINAIVEYMKPSSADIFYIIKTMTHTATLTGELLTGLRVGAGLVARNPVVPPTIILKRIEDLKPTIVFANPTILRILLKVKSGKFDLSSVRIVYTSGSVAGSELIAEAAAFFSQRARKPVFVLNVYGLTEAGPRVTAQRVERGIPKPGSVGTPIQGVSLLIKNPAGGICTPHETGRIYVQTPSVMIGYWGDRRSTLLKIKDGWLDTGDLGYQDEDGDVFIVGRADEVIIRGAHNIDPYRIENVIRQIPGVANCLIFGVPDPVHGSRVICAVQKESAAPLDRYTLMNYCSQHLAPYECPQMICEWPVFPTTPSGKPSRKLAMEHYLRSMKSEAKR